MTMNRKLAMIGVATGLVAAARWIVVFNGNDNEVSSRDDALAWFESGSF